MGYWEKRGLRGDAFEELINMANDKYRTNGIALIQKIPTPIKPVELDSQKGNIKKAYFEKRSTVDYIGLVQGVPICFDAKNVQKNILPLSNIHSHQLDFMADFEKQEGISFFLVRFELYNEIYLLPYSYVRDFVAIGEAGGRKSIKIDSIRNHGFLVKMKQGYFVHYLDALNEYLQFLAQIKEKEAGKNEYV